jgi:hypothetical protein
LANFKNFECYVFCHGQKVNVEDFTEELIDILQNFENVEIGLASTYNIPSKFVSVDFDSKNPGTQYSNFNSSRMVNLSCSGAAESEKLFKGSYHSCIYNDFQHFKKKYNYKIKETKKELGLESFASAMLDKLCILDNLLNSLPERCNIRFEAYYRILNFKDFKGCLKNITSIPAVNFVSLDSTVLTKCFKKQILYFSTWIRDLKSLDNVESECLHLAFLLYEHLISGIYSLNIKKPGVTSSVLANRKFVMGVGCSSFYYNTTSPKSFLNTLNTIFGHGPQKLDLRIYFMLEFFECLKNHNVDMHTDYNVKISLYVSSLLGSKFKKLPKGIPKKNISLAPIGNKIIDIDFFNQLKDHTKNLYIKSIVCFILNDLKKRFHFFN